MVLRKFRYDNVAPPVAENEKIPVNGVQIHGLLHQKRESVDGFAHVRAAGGQIESRVKPSLFTII